MDFCKKKDLLLMTHFRRNSRENLTQISRLTNIPVSTIFDKLREYEKGLIQRHTTLIDFRRIESFYDGCVIFFCRIRPGSQ